MINTNFILIKLANKLSPNRYKLTVGFLLFKPYNLRGTNASRKECCQNIKRKNYVSLIQNNMLHNVFTDKKTGKKTHVTTAIENLQNRHNCEMLSGVKLE